MCLLFFYEESKHEVSRRYLIPEYDSCKISVSKIYKKGNYSKKYHMIFFLQFSTDILFTIPYQMTQVWKVIEKQWTGTGAIKSQIPLLKPKREINKYNK